MRRVGCALAALMLGAAPVLAEPLADPQIIVATTTPGAFLTAADGSETPLKSGDTLRPGAHLRTDGDGTANLIFADRSSLTLGHNSALALERFDYDANGQGALALKLDQGALRFVGGRLSKSGDVAVKLGAYAATLKGGIATFTMPQQGNGLAALLYGDQLTVEDQTITRGNYGITLPENGGTPSGPSFLNPNLLATINQQFFDVLTALLKQQQQNQALTPEQQRALQQQEEARRLAQELLDKAKQQQDQELLNGITQIINGGIQYGFNTPGHTVQDSMNRQILEDTKKNVPGI